MGGGGGDDGGGSGGGSGGGDGGGGEGGGMPCSSISVEINLVLGEHQTVMVAVKPTDGKILAQTLAVANNPNATDTADLELRAIAAKLMLSCSIPLGQSGLQVSEFRGSFEMDKDINMMRISVGADIETVMSVPPPIDAAVAEASVDATIQIKPSPYFRVEGEVTLIGFITMAEGYAQVDFTNYGMPNGVEAEVTIRYPVFMEGYAGFHLWTDWDPGNGDGAPELSDFHFTGWAGVRIGISEGLIWEGCLGALCISIPPFDLWLAEVSAEIGEFCAEGGGSVWGFKCGISILERPVERRPVHRRRRQLRLRRRGRVRALRQRRGDGRIPRVARGAEGKLTGQRRARGQSEVQRLRVRARRHLAHCQRRFIGRPRLHADTRWVISPR